jgi:hypothetical protein
MLAQTVQMSAIIPAGYSPRRQGAGHQTFSCSSDECPSEKGAAMSQDLYNIIVGIAGTAIGWILKVVWDSVNALQKDMKEIERELHTEYVSKDDYRQDIVEMKGILKQIFDKLDRKADK